MMALQGITFRKEAGRLTQAIAIDGQSYFIKQHTGVGWREIFKNLLYGRLPIISAKNEWVALQKCKTLGIASPHVYGYGKQGINPAQIRSFVLMEALQDARSLEEISCHWKAFPPSFALKNQFTMKVAQITRTLHDAGINHRDLYICHFLLKDQTLYLIDLHRAQIRKRTPSRWRIKDLAALYFSSMDIGLTHRDRLRFMRAYQKKPLNAFSKMEHTFWEWVKKRGEKLYCEHQ